ncbi:DUF2147 domain-containing protein [Litoribacter ruber]|uniref:DUF2147 domain-containing protein n=1 Tax=Litoribacter ruber TaxID=702568 RepID=A0AAP2G675_9BACT|nr:MULTISPECIES: DUF2147 domain-containing protein [Litoribacter]MBS9525398.1 DUF2147 domain-containing protein [Litoribacter alkaliphilus]MBT0810480.1 DUF2147 domain-containing protein [Litoribacter ruber]
MKTVLTKIAFVFVFLISHNAFSQSADDIKGTWYNTEKDAKVEIFQEGDKYYGKIVWLKEPEENGKPKVDKNNSDKSKRDRPIMGMRLLRDFEFDGNAWEEGTIYDPKNGKTYSSIIKMKNPNTLEVRGYVGISLIGRTVEWTRAD